MDHETASIWTRWGLCLGIASAFFAAPEVIGETRLKIWQLKLAAKVGKFPEEFRRYLLAWIFGGAVCCLLVLTMYFVVIPGVLNLAELKRSINYAWCWDKGEIIGPLILLVAPPLVYILYVFLIRRMLERGLIPVLDYLIRDREQRKSSMVFGLILFVLSTLLQLIGTFDTPDK